MTVSSSNVQFIAPVMITDTPLNGGIMGYALFTSFREVGYDDKETGITRYSKIGLWDKDPNEIALSNVRAYLDMLSIADDRYHIGLGTHDDTQSDWISDPPLFTGSGVANTDLVAGDLVVAVLMEGPDAEFVPGGMINIANKIMTSQTLAAGVDTGDYVIFAAGMWSKVSPMGSFDPTYPNGIAMGSNKVYSNQVGTTVSTTALLEERLYTDEVIGTGDGASASPSLSTLANAALGIVATKGWFPVITATAGATERTVTIDRTGACSGYCTAGQLDLSDGTWTTPIAWIAAPDNATDILATYNEKNYSYTGNVATLYLSTQVAAAYTAAETIVAGCISQAEVGISVENFSITSGAGTYDIATYPIVLSNLGTREDTITLTFTNATTFTAAGANAGSLGTGSFGDDFAPINPNTGQPYFTLSKDGFGGVWATGNEITFDLHPAIFNIVTKQIVPASTTASKSSVTIGTVWE